MSSLWRDIDRRAGYQRQEEENRNAVITCECGARVLTRLDGKLVHCGDCSVIKAAKSHWCVAEVF